MEHFAIAALESGIIGAIDPDSRLFRDVVQQIARRTVASKALSLANPPHIAGTCP
jgi:hypothetical protein